MRLAPSVRVIIWGAARQPLDGLPELMPHAIRAAWRHDAGRSEGSPRGMVTLEDAKGPVPLEDGPKAPLCSLLCSSSDPPLLQSLRRHSSTPSALPLLDTSPSTAHHLMMRRCTTLVDETRPPSTTGNAAATSGRGGAVGGGGGSAGSTSNISGGGPTNISGPSSGSTVVVLSLVLHGHYGPTMCLVDRAAAHEGGSGLQV